VTPVELTALEGTFSADMTAARKLGTDRTLAKKISRQALLDALMQDALYCQGLARHDLNTLLTSGYEVVSTNRTPGPLDAPQIGSIDNSMSGQLTVRGGAVLNGADVSVAIQPGQRRDVDEPGHQLHERAPDAARADDAGKNVSDPDQGIGRQHGPKRVEQSGGHHGDVNWIVATLYERRFRRSQTAAINWKSGHETDLGRFKTDL
jgi:hypothetical protein